MQKLPCIRLAALHPLLGIQFVFFEGLQQGRGHTGRNSAFDISGKVTARLYAWYKFITDPSRTELNLVEPRTLVTFNVSCPPGYGSYDSGNGGTFPAGPAPVGADLNVPSGDHIALSAPGGTTAQPTSLTNVSSVPADGQNGHPPAPQPADLPPGVSTDLPLGVLNFQLQGLTSGAATQA